MLPKGFDHNTEERKGKKEIQKGGDGTEQYLHREVNTDAGTDRT